jgi:hypothetical protein
LEVDFISTSGMIGFSAILTVVVRSSIFALINSLSKIRLRNRFSRGAVLRVSLISSEQSFVMNCLVSI